MAQIQENIGIPTVDPASAAPDSTQRVNVSADAFGGGLAQGGEKLGAGLEAAGKSAFDIGEFYGKVSVDDQINHLMTEAEKIRKGSGQMASIGPDGQPVYDTGYMGLQGRAALDARQDTEARLDAAIKAGRSNLKTPAEQLAYDTQSRAMRRTWKSEIGTHADSQFKVWAQGVNEAGAGLAVRQIASNADNPEMVAHATADLINFRVKAVETKFGDDPAIKRQAIEGAKRDALTAQLEAISVKEPARAQQILEKNKDIAGENYKTLAAQFRERADHQIAIGAAAEAAGVAAGNMQQRQQPSAPGERLTPAAVGSIILKQESNNNPNSPTSVDGAMGPGQIIPATFKQYAKPGESITNAADNRAVSQRIIDDYYRRYDGDVARIAVAYFSGPGNVAPPGSPTPYIEDRADGNGKRTSAYAQDVVARANGNVTGSSPQAMRADATRVIMTNPNLTPDQRTKAVQILNQNYAQAQIAAEADARAKKEANDTAANGYVTRMINRKGVDGIIFEIGNDPNLDHHTKIALQNMAEAKLGNDVEKATTTYGSGFWDAYKKVTAPAGDKDRISDLSQLLPRAGPGGDLTLVGIDKLNQVMQSGRKSVEGSSVNTTKTGLMNYAKGKLSFEQDLGPVKIRDPKGEALFNSQFIPKFEAAYDQWVKDGKNPWEFLTQENVDKLMKGMRSKDEMAQDRMKATGEAGGEDKPNAPLPPAPDGVDAKVWANAVSKPPMLATGKEATKAQWGQVLGILLSNPTPTTVAFFNKRFAADGYDGNEILKRFGKAPTGAPAAEKPKEDDKPGLFGRSLGALKDFRDNNRAAIAAQSSASAGTEALPQ